MKALVTGAAGFIGSHVVQELMREEVEVRAMILPGEDTRNLEGTDVERIEGDVRDLDGMRHAIKGCNLVFHLAAIYSLWLPRMELMEEVNVGGTRNVLEASRQEGVERVVYTSTLAVFAGQGSGIDATEESPFALGDTGNMYSITKHRAHQVALEYVDKGMDIVIAAPCGPFGPNDVQPTPTGRFLLSLVNLPVCPIIDSTNNMVDVRDVARGHILAWRKGRTGETYLLGNENLREKDMAQMAMEITGLRKPVVSIPTPLMRLGSHFLLAWSEYVSRKPPLGDPSSVEISVRGLRVDCSKAFSELGLPRRPIRDSIRDSLIWFARNGYVKNKKARKKLLSMEVS